MRTYIVYFNDLCHLLNVAVLRKFLLRKSNLNVVTNLIICTSFPYSYH